MALTSNQLELLAFSGPGVTLPSERQIIGYMQRGLFSKHVFAALEPADFNAVATFLMKESRAAAPRWFAPASSPTEPAPATPRKWYQRAEVPPTAQSEVVTEARIREMKGADAAKLVNSLRLDWPGIHPTNPGITSMRAKNALYSALRRGVNIPL